LARAGDLAVARQSFSHVLRHRTGRWPHNRANGLDGVAGTLAVQDPDVSTELAGVAAAIRVRHGLVTPPWLTTTSWTAGRDLTVDLTEDEAVALALNHDMP
jgi:hypothetical protein